MLLMQKYQVIAFCCIAAGRALGCPVAPRELACCAA